MKLAICYYGQPRFYEEGFKYTQSLYKGCSLDYYGHFWGDDEDKNKLESFYNPKKFIIEKQVEKFKDLKCEPDLSRITKNVFVTISPLYSMQKLHEVIKNTEEEYDFWVLTRTDVGIDCDFSLIDLELDKDKIYTTYVRGNEWMVKYMSVNFIMCDKKSILDLTNIYENLNYYICEKNVPLCHHHLFFNSIKDNAKMEAIVADPGDDYTGGWRFIRNGKLSKE